MVELMDWIANIVALIYGAEDRVLNISEPKFIAQQPMVKLRDYLKQWTKNWSFVIMILNCLEWGIIILGLIQVYTEKPLLQFILGGDKCVWATQ